MSRAILVSLALLLSALASACDSAAPNGLQRVDGLVEEAQGEPFGLPRYLSLRDGDGRLWEFAIAPTVTFTTSHLLQHKARFEKVVVHYRETPEGGLSAVQVTD